MAQGIAPGWLCQRPERVAHGDAGGSAAEMRRRTVRFAPFSSRLLSVLVVLAPADPIREHTAWQARPAGTPAGVHNLFFRSGDFDFRLPAPSGAAGELDT